MIDCTVRGLKCHQQHYCVTLSHGSSDTSDTDACDTSDTDMTCDSIIHDTDK